MTLTRNGKYWQARWTDARGRRRAKSLGACTEAEAQRKLARLEAQLDLGQVTEGRAPRLGDYCERFLDHHPEYAEGTVTMYRQTIRSLMEAFAPDLRLDRITGAAAADWRASLAAGQGRGVETVCRYVREAKHMFGEAVSQGILVRNPFASLQGTPPVPDKQWAYVGIDDLDRMLRTGARDWRLLLGLCRLAGLRKGEALRLTWADVDLERRRLSIVNPGTHRSTKKRSRQVPIVPRLHDLLFGAWMGGIEGERLVTLRPTNLHREFRVICQRANVVPFGRACHTLRKNCETDWMAEHPAAVVAEWLGHSVAVAMQHYVRAEDRDFERAAGVPQEVAR